MKKLIIILLLCPIFSFAQYIQPVGTESFVICNADEGIINGTFIIDLEPSNIEGTYKDGDYEVRLGSNRNPLLNPIIAKGSWPRSGIETNNDPHIYIKISQNGSINQTITIIVTSYENGAAPTMVSCKPIRKDGGKVEPIDNVTLCNKASSNVINFIGNTPQVSFRWTNDNTSTGLASNGTGNSIPSFIATNETSDDKVSTISIYAELNECDEKKARVFKITVKPSPDVKPIPSLKFCSEQNTNKIVFKSTKPLTTFTWTNDNTAYGLSANGTGDIDIFKPLNNTQIPITSTITVTPKLGNCEGKEEKFTITVNPTPAVEPVGNKAYCHNTTTNLIIFNSFVTGTTYTWTNDNIKTGLTASGTGNLPSFAATNSSNAPIVSNITVTPKGNDCIGTPLTFSITINPTPSVDPIISKTYCNNVTSNDINFTSLISGTTYTWTNDNTSTGLTSSGTENILSFKATNTTNAAIISNIIVTPSTNGCTTGTPEKFTITVNPTPSVQQEPNQTYCNGIYTSYITYSSLINGTTYTWTNDNTGIGFPSSGSGNIPSFEATNAFTSPIASHISVTPSANGCTGTPMLYNITINPTPNIQTFVNPTYCNTATTNSIAFISSLSSTTYTWVNDNSIIGLSASGTGNIPSFTATNNTTAPIMAHITVTPTAYGCKGPTYTFTITVNPTPTVQPVSNKTYCNATSTNSITFNSQVSGTTYTWTNDNTSTGLVANGSGTITNYTATNNTNSAITSLITVTPTANGCSGPSLTFNITVFPTTVSDAVPSQTYCSGNNSNVIIFKSTVSGTIYSWVNDNPTIGLPSSGTGNLQSFTTVNSSSQSIVAHITVTPSANGCAGTDQTFNITINPTPAIQAIPNQYYCNGSTTTSVPFSSNVTGTTYSWVNSNTSTGLSASGVGNLPIFKATNSSVATTISNITVTPTNNGCIGQSLTFSISVNPTPTMQFVPNSIYCTGVPANQIVFSSLTTGTTYTWVNDNTSTGLASSGSGDISSFTTTNTSSVKILSNITVTPSANGCTGTPFKFTLTVNPTPTVQPVQDFTYCNGTATTSIQFASPQTGTTYSWMNSNSTIGLQSSGTENINSFITADTSNSVKNIGQISVTPTANNCIGTVTNFKIIVNPTAVISPISDKTYCNGVNSDAVTFTSSVIGTTYLWVNDAPSNGFASSGNTSIPSFVTTNNSTLPVNSKVTVTPSANGCTGTPLIFNIKVNPEVLLTSSLTPSPICDSTMFSYTLISSANNTEFKWQRAKVKGIQNPAASGVGNINEILINNTSSAISVIYIIDEEANGCTNTQIITVIVNPTPFLSIINKTNQQQFAFKN